MVGFIVGDIVQRIEQDLKGKTFKYRMKNDKNRNCEYCGWEGPCDIHRPIAGKMVENMQRIL